MGLKLRDPLLFHVLEGVGVDCGETNKENVSAAVTCLGAEVDIIILSCSIPQGNIYKLPIKVFQDAEVIEDGGDVMFNKSCHRISHQKATLSDCPITNNTAFDDLVNLSSKIITLLGSFGCRIIGLRTGCHDEILLFL